MSRLSIAFLVSTIGLAIFGLGGIPESGSDMVWLLLFLISLFAYSFALWSSDATPAIGGNTR